VGYVHNCGKPPPAWDKYAFYSSKNEINMALKMHNDFFGWPCQQQQHYIYTNGNCRHETTYSIFFALFQLLGRTCSVPITKLESHRYVGCRPTHHGFTTMESSKKESTFIDGPVWRIAVVLKTMKGNVTITRHDFCTSMTILSPFHKNVAIAAAPPRLW
jgi:hypothetical protein